MKAKRRNFMAAFLSLILVVSMMFGNAASIALAAPASLPTGLTAASKTASLDSDGLTATVTFDFNLEEVLANQPTDIVLVFDVANYSGGQSRIENIV